MDSVVLVAIITTIGSIVVAFIGVKSNNNNKKIKADIDSLKNNKEFTDLRDERRRAFEDREEAYNELTLATARHLIHGVDINTVEQQLLVCSEKDTKYKEITNRYLDKISKLVEK